MKHVLKPVFVVALMALLISSCGLFRGKNKCHTCPAWNKTVEHMEESQLKNEPIRPIE